MTCCAPWHNGIVPRRPSIATPIQAEKRTAKVVRFKNPAAVALGKLGGSKGGRIRAERLSPEARTAIAQQAAKARWAKEKAE